jgi:hypothetical protein
MSFLDFRGCMLKSEIEIFIFKKNIKLEKLDLQTKESSLKGGLFLKQNWRFF